MKVIALTGLLAALATGARLAGHRAPRPSGGADASLTIVMRTARNLGGGDDPAALVERLRRQGVGHVWIQFKQDETDEHLGGMVFYPSNIAPVAPGFAEDRLGDFIARCRGAGIVASAWVPALHDPAAWQRHVPWRAKWIDWEGKVTEQTDWLCPRNPEVIEYQAGILREILTRYPDLSAVYTDFIRYDSDYACVCDRCLRALDNQTRWSASSGRTLTAQDIVRAAAERGDLWQGWIDLRARSICRVVDAMRDAIDSVADDTWFGACVLPFSAEDYAFNTQAGQDLYEMARRGLDEIVLMGYWDDWSKTPEWLGDSIAAARKLVGGEASVTCLIDGDMPLRRTMLTLAVTDLGPDEIGFFNYGTWSDDVLSLVHDAAVASANGARAMPAKTTAVVIRIDTEPDDRGRYDVLHPDMIRQVMDLLESAGARGTFITCARLAELEPDVFGEVIRRGHEIGVHAYDHEQLDALTEPEQIAVLERSFEVFARLALPVTGFGAPRNSMTTTVRNWLIDHGVRYDGSESYDPTYTFLDAHVAAHTEDPGKEILVLPFIEPNDWDARRVGGLSAEAMLRAWKERLQIVRRRGEPCFIIDVHQWLVTEPDNLEALRAFVDWAGAREDCRIMTLQRAAVHTRVQLDALEQAVRPQGAAR